MWFYTKVNLILSPRVTEYIGLLNVIWIEGEIVESEDYEDNGRGG